MKYGRYGWSYRWLSWGLGAAFVWMGLDMLLHGGAWQSFVPAGLPGGFTEASLVQGAGAVNSLVGVALLMQWWPRITALVAVLELVLAVLLMRGGGGSSSAAVGLLGASLAVLFWPHGYRKHHAWMFWRKKSSSSNE